MSIAAATLIALAMTATPKPPPALARAVDRCTAALVAKHGDAERDRAARGAAQAAAFWRPSDGDAKAFEALCVEQFRPRGSDLDQTFKRFEASFEALDGNGLEIARTLSSFAQLDVGPMQPVDGLLAAYDPSAHVVDDLFDGKIAFAALLNFPLTTLDERLRQGEAWSRREWAEARLANRFARRVPAAVNREIAKAGADADLYIADYNVYVHHLVDDQGARLFPKGKRLLSHWNLRDELKAQYADPQGLARQRAIAKVMERIVTQTIPAAVVNDPAVDWNPWTNAVRPAPADAIEAGAKPRAKVDGAREADVRYARILANFRAQRAADPYSPSVPTLIARKFELERELPEARVVAMLEEVLGAPEIKRIAALIEARLGRKLEPFDIWYPGFKPRARQSEAELDAMTRKRYPTPAAFAKDLPNVLQRLGFAPEKAAWLAERIAVDPARGSGHAMGAARRGDQAHLRTRVGPDGMDYKGFNIAVHELGHNVEQTFSLYGVDSTLLQGVPNTAFTEAIAFVFQARDLEVLGLPGPGAEEQRLRAVSDLWDAYEISGVALVDLGIWKWMYAHPQATPAQLREATLGIARDVWNRWYAPVLGARDVPLLAIYSHIVSNVLYVPDYPVGRLISAQIEDHLAALPKNATLGSEIERMTTVGAVSPDLWMKKATGAPVSATPLVRAAARALDAMPAQGATGSR
ncbi:conserved hypothetical protein [Anaeromyxobacter dehalogenans 2CP-1]|uniref:M3 family oligoendopeptidase n=1 Tax=Anaeromyxobacter dehalogenans (strain ATCC BAA-258 / DSM 21875 / 2CP-1) TaxID=455488 RepID=B8J7J6_ANAD2|nr:hypothetical protein [Anaeromyxobacter dehalogenans]ACL67176.1 conserved hypothetical protein [Anaeromyxobacter dehalogenans 2CP-1]